MKDPEQKLGSLIPELSKLADWLDQHRFPISAGHVRDWHVQRDGAWRKYAAELAWLPELMGPSNASITARSLLRSSRSRIAKFFA